MLGESRGRIDGDAVADRPGDEALACTDGALSENEPPNCPDCANSGGEGAVSDMRRAILHRPRLGPSDGLLALGAIGGRLGERAGPSEGLGLPASERRRPPAEAVPLLLR